MTSRSDRGSYVVRVATWLVVGALCPPLLAQPFRLPTANRALFEKGGEVRFFAPTVGKPWTSGQFGCVRSDGWQMHEGLDILTIQRDRRGEPTDPVMATAIGRVAYVNRKAGLSNYGKYIIVRHDIDGLEVYSLYAHLREIRDGVSPGVVVQAGETLGILGRTSNTASGIGKDRAHVHFELNLLANDRFATWFKKAHPGERNDHGLWNGRNMIGLDPRAVLLAQEAQGTAFNLRQFVRSSRALCRVLVQATDFPWVRRYKGLIVANPVLGGQPPAGYELALDYNGVPCQIIPRTQADLRGTSRYRLLSVDAAEYERNHCRKLVVRRGQTWELTTTGQSHLELLRY
jgi:peptidoglycan LD-endopeptidase LytH